MSPQAVVSFLDPKRAQNVGIQIANLKKLGTYTEMRALIMAGDQSKLGIDELKILQQVGTRLLIKHLDFPMFSGS